MTAAHATAAVETARADAGALAAMVAEIDDADGAPRAVEPVANTDPRPSAIGFRPLGDAVLPVRDCPPPDRPPRTA